MTCGCDPAAEEQQPPVAPGALGGVLQLHVQAEVVKGTPPPAPQPEPSTRSES